MNQAPEFTVNEDGRIMSVRRDLARSPAAALRYAVSEFDWLLEDLPIIWSEDESECHYDKTELILFCRKIKKSFMRQATDADDWENYEWGRGTWFWCSANEPGAVAYWELPEATA